MTLTTATVKPAAAASPGTNSGPRLEQLLEEWSECTTAKQRITGRRLQRALREKGYEIGLSLMLECLREWRRTRAEVYVQSERC